MGVDLGDRASHLCVLDQGGRVVERGRVPTTRDGIGKRFGKRSRMRIAMEVSPRTFPSSGRGMRW